MMSVEREPDRFGLEWLFSRTCLSFSSDDLLHCSPPCLICIASELLRSHVDLF